MSEWRSFWDEVHRSGHDLWLTDTPPKDYLSHLDISPVEGMRILEVGVGRGVMVRYLLKQGCRVTACDISPVALDTLPSGAETVVVGDLPMLDDNSHDLGISYLALQHMPDEMARFVVRECVRICGVFKFQSAEKINAERDVAKYDGPMYLRDTDELTSRMPELRFNEIAKIDYPGQNICWRFLETRCR